MREPCIARIVLLNFWIASKKDYKVTNNVVVGFLYKIWPLQAARQQEIEGMHFYCKNIYHIIF